MTKRDRVLTVLLAAAVLFVMLSSVLFIAIEADHDCTGENCPICYQIAGCENILKFVGQAVFVLILAVFTYNFAISLLSFVKKQAYHTSLITLKVKLSN